MLPSVLFFSPQAAKLNKITAQRRIAILHPIKVVITNYPEDKVEYFEVSNNPQNPEAGTRKIPFTKNIVIDADDFAEVPPPKFFRLKPDGEVRLMGSYIIKCNEIIKDENGEIVDGDKLIAIFSKYLKEKGKLKNNTAVVTVMSNMGFFKFCEENGIECEKAKVGDRYVLENMLKGGHNIGGEQSGHIIFSDHSTTGDGELSALKLLLVMKETGKKLSELASEMKVYPQTLINVRVSDFGKARFPRDKEIKNAIESAEKELGDTGRVLVRVSGTEPLVRVMLEGKDEEKINILAQEIAQVIKERLL